LSIEPPHRGAGYFHWTVIVGLFVCIVVGDLVWNRGPASYLPLALIVALWTGVQYVALRRSRIPVQVWMTRSGYGTRRGRGAMKVRAWSKWDDVDFRRGPGGYCLVITRGFRTTAYVELPITRERALALRERVQEVTGRQTRLER
jgi:hypothetical protein